VERMPNTRARPRRTVAMGSVAALGSAAIMIVGCGSNRLETVPVRGEVRVDGKPVAGVQVVFHPVGSTDGRLAKLRPTGRTAADGTYEIGTYEMADGAPLAEYLLTAEWFAGGPETTTSSSEDPEAHSSTLETDRLGGRFASPEASGFKASIGRLTSDIPQLNLSTTVPKPPG